MFTDTHCHLDFPEFDKDREQVIRRAKEEGLDYLINIGSSLEGSRKSLELAGRYDCIFATAGIHPHEADGFNKEQERALREIAQNKKVVAIGETGLDYYKNYSKAQNQRALFNSQINIAKDSGLPLVIHSRSASDEILGILKKAMPLAAVVHCFSGDENFLKECLGLGFFISFTCNITYQKADNLRALAEAAPLERLLLETDAPFLPPQEYRGKRNEPAYVKLLAEEIARLKGIKCEEVAAATTENARRFFDIK